MVDPDQATTGAARIETTRTESGLPLIARLRPKRNRTRVAVVALAAFTLAAAGYWWTHRTAAPHYLTATVSRGDVQRTVTASGTINPMTTVQVGTYVSGVLQELHCDYNTEVKAGQLCAKIDPRPYQSIVDQETAALGTARAQLAKDQANLAFAKVVYDRNVDLLKRRIVSQETVDGALNAWQQAQAQVALDESTIAQRVASLSSAKVNLDYTNIISPVDGTVVSRNVTQGQTVAASFQTPTLFLIATDLKQMQVDTNVSESDIGNVAVGNKVLFTVEAYPDETFTGTVTQVRQAPQSIQNVITYDAVVGVPNPKLFLKPGMTASVRIVTAERNDVLRVPDQALRYAPPRAKGAAAARETKEPNKAEKARPAVWRLEDGRPVRVPIEVGLDDDSFSEVLGGQLAEGDTIVLGVAGTNAAAGQSGGAPGGQGGGATGAPGGVPRMPRL